MFRELKEKEKETLGFLFSERVGPNGQRGVYWRRMRSVSETVRRGVLIGE
jgi:hypothetical protein